MPLHKAKMGINCRMKISLKQMQEQLCGRFAAMKKSGSGHDPWKAAMLASTMGATLVACLLAGYWGGSLIAARTGIVIWTIAGSIIGLFAGLANVVMIIKRILEETNE